MLKIEAQFRSERSPSCAVCGSRTSAYRIDGQVVSAQCETCSAVIVFRAAALPERPGTADAVAAHEAFFSALTAGHAEQLAAFCALGDRGEG